MRVAAHQPGDCSQLNCHADAGGIYLHIEFPRASGLQVNFRMHTLALQKLLCLAMSLVITILHNKSLKKDLPMNGMRRNSD